MRAVSHYTGESGGGKSSLDMNFGIGKTATKRRVAEGQGSLDISDPVSLARTLNHKPLKKTVSYAITFSRQDAKDPILNKSAKDARLQSHSTRHYLYDDDGMPTAVHIEEQSFLPVGGEQKMVTLQGMWPDTAFPYPEIIPDSMLLSPEINIPVAIVAASSIVVSKADKDRGLQSRREENEARAMIGRESKEMRNQMWVKKAEDDAILCGLSPYVLCSTAGCIRQFTSAARLDQHIMCGTHQSNGNALSQSSKPLAPTKYDKLSVTEMAVESMLQRITSVGEDSPVGHYVANSVNNSDHNLDRFGWSKRSTLKHPPLNPAIVELLNYLFHRGNKKGNSKCSPSAMLSIAAIYGTESFLFVNDRFWNAAIEKSSGRRIFSDAEIPEEWQVKQYISQMATSVKAKSKAVAGVQILSPEDKLIQLKMHLSQVPRLPVDSALLSAAVLGLGIELSYIKQKDIKAKIKELGVFSASMLRSVIDACKKVGKPSTNALPTIEIAEVASEEDLQQSEETRLQDEYDAERNNDDLDDEFPLCLDTEDEVEN
jgi:hypothetical protein